MSDYFKMRDEKNLVKIDELLSGLPEFVGHFIVGISSVTSTLTRLNYANDIKIFLTHLSRYRFSGKPLEDITLSDMECGFRRMI